MKNYTITEEQIKNIEADGIGYIKKWFPEVFKPKELKIGTWYKNKNLPTTIINCQVFEENVKTGYGIHQEFWSENWGLLNYEDYTEATGEEISTVLIKEAEKRGFKDGVYANNSMIEFNGCNPIVSKKCKLNFKLGYSSFEHFNDLRIKGTKPCNSAFIIFKDGIWAEVIKEEFTLNFQQIADKFGIDVEQLRITKI